MWTRQHKQRNTGRLIIPSLCAAFLAYFGFHAYHGEFGITSKYRLQAEVVDLQAQLEGTENRIAVERGRFNDTAMVYNTAVKSFPAMIFAGMLGFHPKPYFQSDVGAEKPPEVNFDFGGKPAPTN